MKTECRIKHVCFNLLVSMFLVLSLIFSIPIIGFADYNIGANISNIKELTIEKVEITTGGEIQSRFRRNTITSKNGKYFTDSRDASMTDARIFYVTTTVDYSEIGITSVAELDVNKLNWSYGGKELSEWKKVKYDDNSDWPSYMGYTGDPAITVIDNSLVIEDNPSDRIITIEGKILFDAYYEAHNVDINRPYEGFTPAGQSDLTYPSLLKVSFANNNAPIGTYILQLSYSGKTIAQKDITLNLYDGFKTWDELNKDSQDLKTSIDNVNNVVNGRYIKVTSIGKSEYGRDVWNVVIAKDAQSVEDYLNITRVMMNTDAAALKDEIDNPKAISSGYHKIPVYFNNTHADEVAGVDGIWDLVEAFLKEDQVTYKRQINTQRIADNTITWFTGSERTGYTKASDDETKEIVVNVDEVLDRLILVFTLTNNPDGRANLVRVNDYGFNVNRDVAIQTLPEGIATATDIAKWDPISLIEFHGHVSDLLMEPCTAPHDPNYEYDLLAENMLNQADYICNAIIGSTGYDRYEIAARDYNDSWDDSAPSFAPQYAQHFGTYGYTIEIPHASIDSVDACYYGGISMIDDNLKNIMDYYENKLEIKQRGIDNEDNPNVDKMLLNPFTNELLGRPRKEGESFFPEYYVIPVDDTLQSNPLAAYEFLKLMPVNNIILKKTTEEITYEGKIYPVGTYVIDMHQGNRGLANVLLFDGYDASMYIHLYGELVISHQLMRGFDRFAVTEKGIFDGKTVLVQANVIKPITNIPGDSEKIIIYNNNIDVIKLINQLLNDGKTVKMLTRDYGNAQKGDFVVERQELELLKSTFLVYGEPLINMPEGIKTVIKPKLNVVGSSSISEFILKQLGFDYKYVTSIEPDANVVVSYRSNFDATDAIENGVGYVGIGANALSFVKEQGFLKGFDYSSTGGRHEGVIKASYSDNSLVTSNYSDTDYAYVVNGTYITETPDSCIPLITLNNDSNDFIAGWFPNYENTIIGQVLAVSGNVGDANIVLFADNLFNRNHAQFMYNMFANAVFTSAADINYIPFADVKETQEYYEAVMSLAYKDIINGTTRSTYNPNRKITKAEFITMLANMSGDDLSAFNITNLSFSDVKKDDWYSQEVAWAVDKGIIKDLVGKLNPKKHITRQDIAVILDKYLANVEKYQIFYTDNSIKFVDNDQIDEDVQVFASWMLQKGIIEAVEKQDIAYFAPENKVTRAEGAQIIYNLVSLLNK